MGTVTGALASGYDVVELLDRLVQHCVHLLAVTPQAWC